MRRGDKPIHELFDDDALIEEALRRGRRDAIRRHKQAGVPMAIWRDGKVVLIPAEELEAELDRAESSGDRANGAADEDR